MRVLAVLLSRHKALLSTYEKRWAAIIDHSWLRQLSLPQVSFVPLGFNPDARSGGSFPECLYRYLNGGEGSGGPVNGVVVLYQAGLETALNGVRDAVFAGEIPNDPYIENIPNFLIGYFRRIVVNYGVLVNQIGDSTKQQAVSLPLKNFQSEAFTGLVELCRDDSLRPDFQNVVVPQLSAIVKLRGPKRRSKYPDLYFRDKERRFFRLGHERHSKYETGGTHTASCLVNGHLRFGSGLDQERHFNVTVGESGEDRISCSLPNCHGVPVAVRNRTHVNMFSNDFHK